MSGEMDAAVAAVRELIRVRGGDTAAAIEIIVKPWAFGPRQKPGFAAGVRDIAGAPATTEHMHEATMEGALRSLAGWARGRAEWEQQQLARRLVSMAPGAIETIGRATVERVPSGWRHDDAYWMHADEAASDLAEFHGASAS